MCTVILHRRPDHAWPFIIAGNRDEMIDRPFKDPNFHWEEFPGIHGGLDERAGGTWSAINETGVVAILLNQKDAFGPDENHRSRGELVLEALNHGEAADAAQAMANLNPAAYRPFHLLIADNTKAFVLSHGGDNITQQSVPAGTSMITSGGLNDLSFPRVQGHLSMFEAAAPKDGNTLQNWEGLLKSQVTDGTAYDAMAFQLESGFGTRSHHLYALPAPNIDGILPIVRYARTGQDFKALPFPSH